MVSERGTLLPNPTHIRYSDRVQWCGKRPARVSPDIEWNPIQLEELCDALRAVLCVTKRGAKHSPSSRILKVLQESKNPEHSENNILAQPYFEELRKVGILHDSPETAAEKVNEIYRKALR